MYFKSRPKVHWKIIELLVRFGFRPHFEVNEKQSITIFLPKFKDSLKYRWDYEKRPHVLAFVFAYGGSRF